VVVLLHGFGELGDCFDGDRDAEQEASAAPDAGEK